MQDAVQKRIQLGLAIVVISVLGACHRDVGILHCNERDFCLEVDGGLVMARDGAMQAKAVTAYRAAILAAQDWGLGTPEHGILYIDADLSVPPINAAKGRWSLIYDLASAEALANGLDTAAGMSTDQHKHTVDLPTLAHDDGSTVLSISSLGGAESSWEALPHEICHQFIREFYTNSHPSAKDVPQFLDELAAISCESQSSRAARIDQMVWHHSESRSLDWQQIMDTPHPLRASSEFSVTIEQSQLPMGNGLRFRLDPSSQLSMDVGLYYAQAATVGAWLTDQSCMGPQVIGHLIKTWRPTDTFDQWLGRESARTCLPSTASEARVRFEVFVSDLRRRAPIQ